MSPVVDGQRQRYWSLPLLEGDCKYCVTWSQEDGQMSGPLENYEGTGQTGQRAFEKQVYGTP